MLSANPDFEVVAEADDGAPAVALTARLQPDVVLLDVSRPDMDGIEATRRIKASNPVVQVIVVSMHDEEALFRAALQAGASGYVLKGADSRMLATAIRVVAAGELYFTPKMTRMLVRR